MGHVLAPGRARRAGPFGQGYKNSSSSEEKQPKNLHGKNNTPERKNSFFPMKLAFSPVASDLPVKKQFFTGDQSTSKRTIHHGNCEESAG
jgi:hypothetical protein